MTVLAFTWSLDDLDRFSTRPDQNTILTSDPTFNLGDFFLCHRYSISAFDVKKF